ncbi:13853_t:CDS:10, partial [Entrophospora sp. SA101]
KAYIIADNERAIAVLDAFPVSEGHTLLITKEHFVNITEINQEKITKANSIDINNNQKDNHNNQKKEDINYNLPAEKSHWENNSSTNNQIKKINKRLSETEEQRDNSDKMVFQDEVRREFQTWVNSVKYLPKYRIGGQQEPERHALFYGPPGSGKSYLAEKFGENEARAYIFAEFGTETYAGSAKQKMNKVFAEAEYILTMKGQDKPVVIIIDEIDSVGIKDPLSGGASVSETNGILTMIDRIKEKGLNIIVIGITNYPNVLEPALTRTGRLGRQISIPYPTKEEINKMVNYLEKDIKKEKTGAYKYEGNNDFWSNIRQITQDAFARCQQEKVGISYSDLEMSVKDVLARQVSKNSKTIIPQSSDYKEELAKKIDNKIRTKPKKRPNQKEKKHIAGFSPECFYIEKIGEKKLESPLILRPTSEVVFYDYYRQILSSHTLHSSEQEARELALNILADYQDYAENTLCLGVIVGLILPFDIAPVQIAFILIGENEALINYYQEIDQLLTPHYRCQLYNKNKQFNLNILQADKEGCPFKIILGPEELKNGEITLVKRDNVEQKITVSFEGNETEKKYLLDFENNLAKNFETYNLENKFQEQLATERKEIVNSVKKGFKKDKIIKVIKQEITEFKKNIYQKSIEFRNKHIFPVNNYSELQEKIKKGVVGLFLVPFCNNLDCETKIKEKVPSYSIRCIALEKKPVASPKCLFCQLPAADMLEKVKINLTADNVLEIITPTLLSAEYIEERDLLEKFTLRQNMVYLLFPDQAIEPKENNIKPLNSEQENAKKMVVRKPEKLEKRVHTKFSTLDGISSPSDYVASARRKNYATVSVTDYYNVQAFPEFSKHQEPDLQIIYGCELEMLEDNLPPYIFNHSDQILKEKVKDLTYCVFDLETTGFFSAYNEIIEIGYVIYHQGEIIREGEYLICPEKEIAPERSITAAKKGLTRLLKKLSHVPGRGKVIQTHRALDDREVKELINNGYFPNRGYKVKVLATNQEGLHNLYRLITLSHTQRLFKKPCVFRSDLTKYRSGLLIGAAGGREGEIFALFSAFNSAEKIKEAMRFYDYVEVNSPETFCHLWLNGKIMENELKEMIYQIISVAEELKIPALASHNVHYCEKKEKILKEIIVANEGMNGVRHYLYSEATLEEKEDRFAYLPPQHLLNKEEMIDNWLFLNNKELIEKIIFRYPQQIASKVGTVKVKQPPLNYSGTANIKKEENDLINSYTQRTNEIFVVQKTHDDGYLIGSRGSIGSSFIAYLCGITDLNPLPFYKFCASCHYTEIYQTQDKTYSCYDYQAQENCEKTPDIDLNFSGDYQKTAHNYIRQLLGENSVYRIGTINTLSQQTAEIFYKEHLKLRKKLNSPEHIREFSNSELIAQEKIKDLERRLARARKEKSQLETELKKLEQE